jgi:hypothetical protein
MDEIKITAKIFRAVKKEIEKLGDNKLKTYTAIGKTYGLPRSTVLSINNFVDFIDWHAAMLKEKDKTTKPTPDNYYQQIEDRLEQIEHTLRRLETVQSLSQHNVVIMLEAQQEAYRDFLKDEFKKKKILW